MGVEPRGQFAVLALVAFFALFRSRSSRSPPSPSTLQTIDDGHPVFCQPCDDQMADLVCSNQKKRRRTCGSDSISPYIRPIRRPFGGEDYLPLTHIEAPTAMNSVLSATLAWAICALGVCATNPTYANPILPGFHSDPSCIFVESWNQTFFCATSTFLAFPGIPIYASQDLQTWTLISSVFNRPSQLPALATEITQTSGKWAPTIRYRGDTFYVTTTLVDDAKNISDTSRWDNVIFTTGNPYDSNAWPGPIHFDFDGYDPGLFWDDDGQAYVVGSHPWQIRPGIDLAPLNLETGEVGEQETVWNGTGGVAPEGPRAFKKDEYYYLVIAEGGTYSDHMATIARSKTLIGPYESNPANPFLTNSNITEYF